MPPKKASDWFRRPPPHGSVRIGSPKAGGPIAAMGQLNPLDQRCSTGMARIDRLELHGGLPGFVGAARLELRFRQSIQGFCTGGIAVAHQEQTIDGLGMAPQRAVCQAGQIKNLWRFFARGIGVGQCLQRGQGPLRLVELAVDFRHLH